MDSVQFFFHCASSADDFCCAFDLTYTVPALVLDQAIKSSQLVLMDASRDWTGLIDGIAESLASSQDVQPIRICVPLLGSPSWGDPRPKVRVIFCGTSLFLAMSHPWKGCLTIRILIAYPPVEVSTRVCFGRPPAVHVG
jgi:hypothetical protein